MKSKATSPNLIFCIVLSICVFIFFAHTLNYGWKYFDENIIYEETMFPIPASFNEIFELITNVGTNAYFEAANMFYSNISNIRGTPLDVVVNLFVFYFFKKSAFAYHLFSLVLHLMNTLLCFLILTKVANNYSSDQINLKNHFIATILTLVWALHPVNVESVLFAINFGSLITYLFCFMFIFYYLNIVINGDFKRSMSLVQSILLFLTYLFPLFLNEYSVTLPAILFFYVFLLILHKYPQATVKETFFISIKKIFPLVCSLSIYVLYYFSTAHIKTNENETLVVTLQRIFWLSPQIFMHHLKLILFPINLSIDQSSLVKIGKSIFEPYAIFSSITMYLCIAITMASFFSLRKKQIFFYLIAFIPFFLGLLPFLHLISPIYNLASERYLYFPLFLLIFGLSHLLFSFKNLSSKPYMIIILVVILCTYSTRSCIRTFDWKSSYTLLQSAVNTAPNYIYKALREQMTAGSLKEIESNPSKEKVQKHIKKAIKYTTLALNELNLEKIKCQGNLPKIINYYGLDPETLYLKTIFLSAYSQYELNNDANTAVKVFLPYIQDFKVIDTLMLNFFYKVLFLSKNIDEAEGILLKSFKQNRISPILFVALSDLYEYKYKNLNLTEKYLNQSRKYFPYNTVTLFGLKRLYQKLNNAELFAHYSYLYGLCSHDLNSLQEATVIYFALKRQDKAKHIINKLLAEYPPNEQTIELQKLYKQIFGKL